MSLWSHCTQTAAHHTHSRHGIATHIDIIIGPKHDYALVPFQQIQDAVVACHTLVARSSRHWAVDYQPVEDRVQLQILYFQWQTMRE